MTECLNPECKEEAQEGKLYCGQICECEHTYERNKIRYGDPVALALKEACEKAREARER